MFSGYDPSLPKSKPAAANRRRSRWASARPSAGWKAAPSISQWGLGFGPIERWPAMPRRFALHKGDGQPTIPLAGLTIKQDLADYSFKAGSRITLIVSWRSSTRRRPWRQRVFRRVIDLQVQGQGPCWIILRRSSSFRKAGSRSSSWSCSTQFMRRIVATSGVGPRYSRTSAALPSFFGNSSGLPPTQGRNGGQVTHPVSLKVHDGWYGHPSCRLCPLVL